MGVRAEQSRMSEPKWVRWVAWQWVSEPGCAEEGSCVRRGQQRWELSYTQGLDQISKYIKELWMKKELDRWKERKLE